MAVAGGPRVGAGKPETARPSGGLPGTVGHEHEVVTHGAGVDEAQRLDVTGGAEEAVAGAEDKGIDDQTVFVDEIVLDQSMHQLAAGVDDQLPVDPVAQL